LQDNAFCAETSREIYFNCRPASRGKKETTLHKKAESKPLDTIWRKPMKALFLLGRLAFGGFFIYNGINHLKQRKVMAQYAQSKNVPVPEAAVVVTGTMMIAGGSSILLGIKPTLGAAAIVAFLAGVSPVMHDFWKAEDPNQRLNDMVHFSKNMALLGAAIALMGIEEPWPASVPLAQPEKYSSYTQDIIAA
jgi:putative oxidoreductase